MALYFKISLLRPGLSRHDFMIFNQLIFLIGDMRYIVFWGWRMSLVERGRRGRLGAIYDGGIDINDGCFEEAKLYLARGSLFSLSLSLC